MAFRICGLVTVELIFNPSIMTFEKSCVPERAILQTCLASSNIFTKLVGQCQDLEDSYHLCMDQHIEKSRLQSLQNSKDKQKAWSENNKKFNIS
jgi:hypothetical protein